jgi:N-acetylmuramoyl-L-alanine amidase
MTRTILANPNRLVIDGPELDLRFQTVNFHGAQGPIGALRSGLAAPGRTRLVFDLTAPAVPEPFDTPTVNPDGSLSLALRLTPADQGQFEATAAVEAEKRVAANLQGPANPNSPDLRPLIVIDPGHGGQDLGAIGVTGVFEKDVVLTIALALKRKIEAQGQCRVALTRDSDIFVPLEERVKFARQKGAAVFLSVHGDTIPGDSDIRGATVYVGDDRPSDAGAARMAEAENRSDGATQRNSEPSNSAITDILGDLTLRETKTRSNLLARELVTRIADSAILNHNPLRAAGFRVLRTPDIPSALIEIGYLSSKQDIEQLTSREWVDRITSRMADALVDFTLSGQIASATAVQP